MRERLYSVLGDYKGGILNPPLSYLDFQIGTRVRLTRNLCVQMGLFNGAMGTIYGFVYLGDGPTEENRMPTNFASLEYSERELPIILVRMDGEDDPDHPTDTTKSTFRYSCSKKVTRLVPISPQPGQGCIKNDYKRLQYPLLPAHARTAHSLQGYTAHHGVVVHTGSTFFAGDYVAISRAKQLNQVWLLSPVLPPYVTSHPDFRLKIDREYERLSALHPYQPVL